MKILKERVVCVSYPAISLSQTILILSIATGTLKLNIENTYKLTYCAKI